MQPITVAFIGAAGPVGAPLAERLHGHPDYRVLYVETEAIEEARLRALRLTPAPRKAALAQADVVVLAVADAVVGPVATEIAGELRSGALVMVFDPLSARRRLLAGRPDVSCFVTHPTLPPVFSAEEEPIVAAAGAGRQAIVSALVQGPDEDYARGEALARRLFAPVLRSHRLTTEQMAILEPVLSERVAAACILLFQEALDEAGRHAIPAAAARDFLLGHLAIPLATVFHGIGWQHSAGAAASIRDTEQRLFRDAWREALRAVDSPGRSTEGPPA
ncbi:MAG TPA: phosphogluconate dehydrogenase C-terminal domain-containing protein [Armatimonadota bacterium]|nr:phosphogluconate dehydrogenase C-terminal domain-containing protein [Armatimonadota bacterium]